jgi:copper(I)-binding protein
VTRGPRCSAAIAAAALAAAGTLAGCGSPATAAPARISVAEPYIPLPAAPGMAAGYLTVHNTGGTTDQLLKVTSPDADDVTMHRSTASSMEPVDSLPVPAHGVLSFARGGNHIMIMGLHRKPAVNASVELDLHFAGSGTVAVKVPIEPIAYRPPDSNPASGS